MRYKKEEETALNKIYIATVNLIKQKDYSQITISEIIREAKISRSTFYIYFKNKDQILTHVCDDIFNHIFSKNLTKEQEHDFSNAKSDDIIKILTHSLYHFLEDKELIIPILNSAASSIFLKQLRKRIKPIISSLIDRKVIGNNDVPLDMKTHQYINSFTSLLQYYLRHASDQNPELMCKYFLTLCQ